MSTRIKYNFLKWLSRWFPKLRPKVEKLKWEMYIGKPPKNAPMTTIRVKDTDFLEKEKRKRLYDDLTFGIGPKNDDGIWRS